MRLTQDDLEIVKKSIIENAIKIFEEKGYAGTNMEDIAKSANISRSPLYYHFKNKKKLFETAFEEYSNRFIAHTRNIYESDLDIFDKIEQELIGIANEPILSGSTLRSDAQRYADEIPRLSELYTEVKKEVYNLKINAIKDAIACGRIRQDCRPEDIAVQVFLFFYGLLSDGAKWILQSNTLRPEVAIHFFVENLKNTYALEPRV